ncbi:hypothetical protein AWB64_04833 [Caballeronia sordidicola]|uniref:Uncharacterized protein n=1 Tax=Caballeronia sordidicola TaxID=196367 RepID=A0A158HNF6_CABSO|nr:hypothetical protein [Caballeronia sordidicola]SAL45806.1 hypothetical protein AWB64_04833 [Caballeronia sordidicola]
MSIQLSNRCRTSLYRVIFGKPKSSDESVVFLMAGGREAANRRAIRTLAVLFDMPEADVYLYNLASFADLVGSGVSDDEDVRVFETGWKGAEVSAWVEHPLFLTDDTSLLWKWTELCADIAKTKALDAIKRANR